MDAQYTAELLTLGTSLAELAVKGTATAISTKIRAIKDEKSAEKLRSTYDEIVNELLGERAEAIRIAQAYKSELDRVVISDEDIQHLHRTVSSLLEIITGLQIGSALSGESNPQIAAMQQIKGLISVDTLKTMQLLGFNYKAAIGEPLTQLCANAISAWGDKHSRSTNSQQSKRR